MKKIRLILALVLTLAAIGASAPSRAAASCCPDYWGCFLTIDGHCDCDWIPCNGELVCGTLMN